MVDSIVRDSTPQQVKHLGGAMIAVHTGTSQFDDRIAKPLVRGEIKLTLAIKACICRSHGTCLQPIRSHNLAHASVLHNQVVTEGIELIGVLSGRVGGFQSLIQLQVEDQKSQAESCPAVCLGRCQSDVVRALPEVEWPTDCGSLGLGGSKRWQEGDAGL